MAYSRPSIIAGITRASKAFFENIFDGIDERAPLESPDFTGTPTGITKAHVGLSSVDNTADSDKPVSTDTQAALDTKLDESQVDARVTAVSTPLLDDKLDHRRKLPYKTVSVTLSDARTWSLYEPELARIANHGGQVVLCPLIVISVNNGTDFTRVSQTRIDDWFALADAAGVTVAMIKPHIVTVAEGDGYYRMNYNPIVANFYPAWKTELEFWAGVCDTKGIPILCVTVEQGFNTDPAQYSNWPAIISSLRTIAPGILLTNAHTPTELDSMVNTYIPAGNPMMEELLDFIGINSWVLPVDRIFTPATPNITKQELDAGWWNGAAGRTHVKTIHSACQSLGMGYFITEVGLRPLTDALTSGPYDGAEDFVLQGMYFQSVFDTLTNSDWCVGVSIWHPMAPFNYYKIGDATVYAGEQVLIDYYAGGILP